MKKPFYKILYVQVLFAIVLGVLLGVFYPKLGVDLKPLGDGFIKLIKMIIAPVIFCTVVAGIAGMQDMKKVGRVGGKALLYFEIVSTFALAIGLIVANVIRPGAGFNADVAHLDASIAQFTERQVADHDRLPAEHHPEHLRRCLRQGRHPASAADRDPVRPGAVAARRARPSGDEADR
jgi:Na+/H+-dicarboxylate symporter